MSPAVFGLSVPFSGLLDFQNKQLRKKGLPSFSVCVFVPSLYFWYVPAFCLSFCVVMVYLLGYFCGG